MKIYELRGLLKDKRVIEEINKHLWIESQKAGYSIGIERATDEWIRLYAEGWLKYNKPEKYNETRTKKNSAKRQAPAKRVKAKKATKTRPKKQSSSKKGRKQR